MPSFKSIKKNSKDVSQIIKHIGETMNPFSEEISKEHLFNIASGKAAKDETKHFLLSIAEMWKETKESFISECVKRPERFEERIARIKLQTFANDGKRFKMKGTDNKIIAVSMIRALFGSILFLSLQKQIDMAEILSYPLIQVPLALSHADGLMQKTPKVKLLHELEAQVKSTPPSKIDTTIIDGMFFLHLLVDLPSSFGQVAMHILKRVCSSNSNTIHLVFDKTQSPSIKDCERNLRSMDNRQVPYQITGPEQKRPSNWSNALRNDHFNVVHYNLFCIHINEELNIFQSMSLFVFVTTFRTF